MYMTRKPTHLMMTVFIIVMIIVTSAMMLVPIVVTLVGILILVIGHCAYCKPKILVVPTGMVTDVKTVKVYRFISATV